MEGVNEQEPEIITSEPGDVPARTSRRRAIVIGIALVGVGALAGGIAATATGAGATGRVAPYAATATPVPGEPFSGGPGFGPRFGPFGGERLLGLGGQILHGSAVVKGKDGTTRTMELQNGTVTAVSDKALTVKSSDGFSQSYVVVATTRVTKDWQGSTASAIKTGDTVTVLAQQVGSDNQATFIADGRDGFRFRGGFKHFRGGPPAPPSAPPTPNA